MAVRLKDIARELGVSVVTVSKVLRDHPDISEVYQRRVRHVLVDEYQDTNYLQAELLDTLAKRHG